MAWLTIATGVAFIVSGLLGSHVLVGTQSGFALAILGLIAVAVGVYRLTNNGGSYSLEQPLLMRLAPRLIIPISAFALILIVKSGALTSYSSSRPAPNTVGLEEKSWSNNLKVTKFFENAFVDSNHFEIDAGPVKHNHSFDQLVYVDREVRGKEVTETKLVKGYKSVYTPLASTRVISPNGGLGWYSVRKIPIEMWKTTTETVDSRPYLAIQLKGEKFVHLLAIDGVVTPNFASRVIQNFDEYRHDRMKLKRVDFAVRDLKDGKKPSSDTLNSIQDNLRRVEGVVAAVASNQEQDQMVVVFDEAVTDLQKLKHPIEFSWKVTFADLNEQPVDWKVAEDLIKSNGAINVQLKSVAESTKFKGGPLKSSQPTPDGYTRIGSGSNAVMFKNPKQGPGKFISFEESMKMQQAFAENDKRERERASTFMQQHH